VAIVLVIVPAVSVVILQKNQEAAAVRVLQVVLVQNRQDLAPLVVAIVLVILEEHRDEVKAAVRVAAAMVEEVPKVMTRIQDHPPMNGVRIVINKHTHLVLV